MKSLKRLADGSSEQGSHANFVLRAASEADRGEWLAHFERECEDDPLDGFKQSEDNRESFTINRSSRSSSWRVSTYKSETSMTWRLPEPITEGWMKKRGGELSSSWRRRYFMLCETEAEGHAAKGHVLFYFSSRQLAFNMLQTGKAQHNGCVILRSIEYVRAPTESSSFEFELVSPDRVWSLKAESVNEYTFWTESLRQAIDEDNRRYDNHQGSEPALDVTDGLEIGLHASTTCI